MVLLHWPGQLDTKDEEYGRKMRKEVWLTLEEVYKSGRIRGIGASNFNIRHLKTLIEDVNIKPMVN